ncbi:MAG: hypothetical protein IKN50_06105, partial [Clostridia bacterium]|nr:hypothetical protein [Clostridia bacterium]
VQTRPKNTVSNFYFAVAKRTDTGELQIGYYGTDQRGNSDSYIPQTYTDYIVAYDGGYAILEWSIPFSEICDGGVADAGDSVYLSIGAEAGTAETKDGEDFYAVSLGDFTYGVAQKSSFNHAAFLLSDEMIPAPANPDPTPIPPSPGPVDPDNPTPAPVDPDNPNPTPADPDNPNPVTPAKTGDPMIVMAAVAAVSAAGAFIVRKKRH